MRDSYTQSWNELIASVTSFVVVFVVFCAINPKPYVIETQGSRVVYRTSAMRLIVGFPIALVMLSAAHVNIEDPSGGWQPTVICLLFACAIFCLLSPSRIEFDLLTSRYIRTSFWTLLKREGPFSDLSGLRIAKSSGRYGDHLYCQLEWSGGKRSVICGFKSMEEMRDEIDKLSKILSIPVSESG